ncbi:hypothetical protein HDU92_003381 [Lobulomyces angularis]|nr:hypothetical protein HDU92_003381 [Lobulomyces angularis]
MENNSTDSLKRGDISALIQTYFFAFGTSLFLIILFSSIILRFQSFLRNKLHTLNLKELKRFKVYRVKTLRQGQIEDQRHSTDCNQTFETDHHYFSYIEEDQENVLDLFLENLKDVKCCICLEDFKVNDRLRILSCDHVFHRNCVDIWLLDFSDTCPLCLRSLKNPYLSCC